MMASLIIILFYHHSQGRVGFNNVNPSCLQGRISRSTPWGKNHDEENGSAPPTLENYWEIHLHLLCPRDFPRHPRRSREILGHRGHIGFESEKVLLKVLKKINVPGPSGSLGGPSGPLGGPLDGKIVLFLQKYFFE